MSDDVLPVSEGHPGDTAAGENESAGEREARLRETLHEIQSLQHDNKAPETPSTFSLFELMVVVTLLAVTLGLLRLLGLWGALLTFIGCLAWTTGIYPRWYPADRVRQAAMFDGIWGLFMPLVCLVCDPFVFKDHEQLLDLETPWQQRPQFHSEALAAYTFLGWQMLILGVWIVTRPKLNWLAGLFFGTWAIGIMFAVVVGALLALPAAVFSLMGIGMLGFTPIFTAYVIARRMREAIEAGIHHDSDRSIAVFWLLAAFGFMGAVLVPMLIATIFQLPRTY
jgi:hypothetical protein